MITLVAALAYGYAIGFRFSAGAAQAALFCALALSISVALSLGADAIGTLAKSPEATSQALALPQLILGMLSCGFVPETGFPEWIRPFVRNQPISQFSFAMRDMARAGSPRRRSFGRRVVCGSGRGLRATGRVGEYEAQMSESPERTMTSSRVARASASSIDFPPPTEAWPSRPPRRCGCTAPSSADVSSSAGRGILPR